MRRAVLVTVSGEVQDIDLDSRVGALVFRGLRHDLGAMLTAWHAADADTVNPVASRIVSRMYADDARTLTGDVVFAGVDDADGIVRPVAAGWEKNIRRVAEHMRR